MFGPILHIITVYNNNNRLGFKSSLMFSGHIRNDNLEGSKTISVKNSHDKHGIEQMNMAVEKMTEDFNLFM